jgi:hypothetical protein
MRLDGTILETISASTCAAGKATEVDGLGAAARRKLTSARLMTVELRDRDSNALTVGVYDGMQ